MKKISFFALALCAGIAANAQSEPQLRTPMAVKPMFGVMAGVNLARLETKDDATATTSNVNSKTSFHAGVYYDVPVTAAFHIKPALVYSNQGTKTTAMSSSNPTLAGITEIDLHYISLPVMFKFKTPGGFAVEAGPQFSYLSSANADKSSGGGEVNLKDGEFVKDIDFALVGGVGYTTRVGLGAHAKYNYGLTNVWNNEKSPVVAAGMDARNRVVQIGLHYSFGAAK